MSGIALCPRDGLFLKDGREWATSEEGRAHSLPWPLPSTLHGALTTAVGRTREATNGRTFASDEWQALAAEIRLGASLALRRPLTPTPPSWSSLHRVWPVPADALFLADAAGTRESLLRLEPLPPGGAEALGRDENVAIEKLWWPRPDDQRKPAPAPQWWAEAAFVRWLADDAAIRPVAGAYEGLALPCHIQSHVGIDRKTFAAEEEILFSHDVIETLDRERQEWAIGCMLEGLVPAGLATLGGDRRLARIEAAENLGAFPDALAGAFAAETAQAPKGLRLIAITPACFAGGWLPDGFALTAGAYRGRLPGIEAELILRAAIVPRAAAVSGWDMALGRPKPSERLVPPGATYHLCRADGGSFTAADAKALWLCALGARSAQGFGYFVAGIWHLKEEGA